MYWIRFSDVALDAMLMAATEAYFFGEGRLRDAFVEIDGYLWGFSINVGDDCTLIHVERFAPSFSSKRTRESVEPNEDAARLMDRVMGHLCPQLEFLGEVHTHPYDSLDEAKRARGWNFSDEDLKSMSETVWELTGDRPPLWLVIAAAPLKKVHSTLPKELANGVWQFDVGEMRFWLHAKVVPELDEEGVARFADDTFIDLAPRLFNHSGNRIAEWLKTTESRR